MRKGLSLLIAALFCSGFAGAAGIAGAASAAGAPMPGQEIAFNSKKGNCLACHAMPGTKAEMAGSIAPPLIAMKLRYPDRAKLRAQVWDATANNRDTVMPPFGKHKVLTEQEIDEVVDFIHTL